MSLAAINILIIRYNVFTRVNKYVFMVCGTQARDPTLINANAMIVIVKLGGFIVHH